MSGDILAQPHSSPLVITGSGGRKWRDRDKCKEIYKGRKRISKERGWVRSMKGRGRRGKIERG